MQDVRFLNKSLISEPSNTMGTDIKHIVMSTHLDGTDNPALEITLTCVCPACSQANVVFLYERMFQGKRWSLMKCRECGQHFTNPEPSEAEIAAFYAGQYHAEIRQVDASEEIFNSKFRRYIKLIKKFVPKGSRCLDVGCATGLFPKLLGDEGYDAWGIEVDEESAAWGRQHYGARISISTLEDLEMPSTPFGLITFTDVLEHTVDPLRVLERAKQLLTIDGHVLVTFPDITSLESIYYRALSKLFHRDWLWVTCHIPLHTWEFTPKTAASLFTAAGLEVVDFRRTYQPIRLEGKLRVISLLPQLLSIAPRLFGTQMEFMLRRRVE